MKKQLIPLRDNQTLTGTVTVPADKSIAQRSVIFSTVAKGECQINNFPLAGDPQSTMQAMELLGADFRVQKRNNKYSLISISEGFSQIQTPEDKIDCGNSGTGFRLITGLLAGLTHGVTATLIGDESLSKRPMKRVNQPLRDLGADIEGDYAPVIINSKQLAGGEYTMPIASAQVKSALLLSSLQAQDSLTLIQKKQSRNHTEIMLKALGANIQTKDNNLVITLEPSELTAQDINIPGDISSASFLLVAGAIIPNSNITITNVGLNSTRTGIITCLKRMGADITVNEYPNTVGEPIGDITIKYSKLTGTELAGEIIPNIIDEIPILCIAGALATGKTIIKDAKELRVKESDRIAAMAKVLTALGVEFEELEDGLIIQGNGGEKFNTVSQEFNAGHDHRIAMTVAIASLFSQQELFLDGAEWANISFPGFYELINSIIK